MPRLSIIILTYNREHLLLETLTSVFEQSYSDYEIIIVDDGSTDGTSARLEALKDKSIRYYYTDHLGNLSQLRNLGWQYAQGQYVAFLDADDIWLPSKLERQVQILETDQQLAFVYTDAEEFNKHGIIRPRIYSTLEEKWESSAQFELTLSGRMPIYASTVMIRKNLAETIGGFEDNLILGDTHFLLRLARKYPCAVIFEPLVRIRKHDGNISVNQEREAFVEMLAVLRYFKEQEDLEVPLYLQYSGFYHWNFGRFYWRRRQWGLASQVMWKGAQQKILSRLMKRPS